jgi:gas vesicle protein
MKKGKLLTGLLIGAAAGAVVGILLAPAKGEETRKKIAKKTNDLGENLKTRFNNVVDKLMEKVESTKGDAESSLSFAKTKAFEKLDEIEKSIS